MPPERIALIGFMGAGKTTVGALLAARLGYTFVDTDAVVEQRAGAPVAVLFRERGEAAFREMEAAALAELAGRKHLVIASGGGAPAQARNAGFFRRAAATFHLRVSLASALKRTAGTAARPLLAQEESVVRALFEGRQRVYEGLGTGVDTEGRDPAEVVEEIVRLLAGPRESLLPGENG
jgi:shikimate kinase